MRTSAGALGLSLLATACSEQATVTDVSPTPRVMVVETKSLLIDQIYPSMTGPFERLDIDVSQVGWITGIRTDVIDAATQEPMGSEFFCHSQLQVGDQARLTVSATGAEEIRLPPGFGIPVSGILEDIPTHARELTFLGMVLNNHWPEIDRSARIRATIEYVTNEDVGSPPSLKKLYHTNIPMVVKDLEKYEQRAGEPPIHEDHTTHCVLVEGYPNHWYVPPGPQITRRPFKGLVPMEATVHYAQVHMHNHGRYTRLTDKTTGELLWQADVEYEPDRVQIKRISTYSSAEGFRIHPDHQYELEAFYDNTTDADVDAMAMMYLYFNPVGDQELFLIGPNR